jgi:hypothetical protein
MGHAKGIGFCLSVNKLNCQKPYIFANGGAEQSVKLLSDPASD